MNMKNDFPLINYISIIKSCNNDEWVVDGEILVKSLQSLNKLSHIELMNLFINDDNLQRFLNSYLDQACCSYHLILSKDDYQSYVGIEKQIYRLVYKIMIKIFQFANYYGSDNVANKMDRSSAYFVYYIDYVMLVDICCLYFHSPSMCKLLHEYFIIYKANMISSITDYCNAFQKTFEIKINGEDKTDIILYLNEFIHTSLCIIKVIPEFYKDVVNETNIIKLSEMISNKDILGTTPEEYKSLSNRLIHLIFLHITILKKYYNEPSEKLILIFNHVEYIPEIFIPLINLYQLEKYITTNFMDILSIDDYNGIMRCIKDANDNYKLIQIDQSNTENNDTQNQSNKSIFNRNSRGCNQTITTVNEHKIQRINYKQIVLLLEIFPSLPKDTLNKCYIYCDGDILKTIDFIISQKTNQEQINKILSTVDVDDNQQQQSYSKFLPPSLAFSLPTVSINFDNDSNNNNNSNKNITLQLVQQQNQEKYKNITKINQLTEKYMISPGMAATFLNLDFDQYQDEFDDGYDDNNNHFDHIKNIINKNKSNNIATLLASSPSCSSSYASFASAEASLIYEKDYNMGSNLSNYDANLIENSTNSTQSETFNNSKYKESKLHKTDSKSYEKKGQKNIYSKKKMK